MTLSILATDRVSKRGLAPLREDNGFEVNRIHDSTTPEFEEALAGAHALIVRSATKVTDDMMGRAPRLRVIGRAGVGVDNIDVAAATARGIAVFNAPGGNTIAAAELTMALMLSLVRKVTEADRSIRDGRWDRASFRGVELRGRTVGIIGGGRIGGEVAKRCAAFDMEVLIDDPYLGEERALELGAKLVDLEDIVQMADVVSLHVPLTEETRGLIDADALDRMKGSAYLINVSRGGVVDEKALAEALESRNIAGAALDVYESEPLSLDSPLRKAPNLVMTPHLGASTKEAQVGVAREVALAIRSALLDDDVSRALNSGDLP